MSAIFACSGRISEISKASLFVRIGLKGPRISLGASGFMSQRSCWLGAPRLKIMMQDLLLFLASTLPSAFSLAKPGSVSPMALRVPAERKSRRVMPSQVVTEPLSVKVNMVRVGC